MAMTREEIQQRINDRHDNAMRLSPINRVAYENKNNVDYRLHRVHNNYVLFRLINANEQGNISLTSGDLKRINEFIGSDDFNPSLDSSEHPGNKYFRIDQQRPITIYNDDSMLSFQIQNNTDNSNTKSNSYTCANMTYGALTNSSNYFGGDTNRVIKMASDYSLRGLNTPQIVQFLGVLTPDFVHLIKDCHSINIYGNIMPDGIRYDGILRDIRH